MGEVEQPDLRAYDDKREDGGNVRPADGRYLTVKDQKRRDSYVAKVEDAQADALASVPAQDDPFAATIQAGIDRALAASQIDDAAPAGPDDQPALPTGDDA